MAADSLIGGASGTLNETTKSILDSVLNDTRADTVQHTTVGGATVVQGLGANNETQGALVQSDAPVVGTLTNGDFHVNVNLPANVGFTFEGLNQVVTGGEVSSYLNGLIDQALPSSNTDAGTEAFRTSLISAVELATQNAGSNSVVRVLNVTDETTAGSTPTDIVINGDANSTNNTVLALDLYSVNNGNTVVLSNIESSVIVGAGSVRISGETSATVVGDLHNQLIVGGAGNDTIIGGGGSDTLAGGQGRDLFGFNSAGQYTINDFKSGDDNFVFHIPGVHNIAELASLVTNVVVTGGNTTYTFVEGSTITLVGVTPEQLSVDLILFN